MTTTPAPSRTTFSISEVAERTGVSADSLRYYERMGLIEVDRDPVGRRRYCDRDVGRVLFISRLRAADLPIKDLQRYFSLVADGPQTEQERRRLLERHRVALRERVEQVEAALSMIEYKIERYGGSLEACDPAVVLR